MSSPFFPRWPGSVWRLAAASLLLAPSLAAAADREPLAERLEAMIKRPHDGELGVAVVNLSSGATVFAHRETAPLKPASVLKIVISGVSSRSATSEITIL